MWQVEGVKLVLVCVCELMDEWKDCDVGIIDVCIEQLWVIFEVGIQLFQECEVKGVLVVVDDVFLFVLVWIFVVVECMFEWIIVFGDQCCYLIKCVGFR